MLNHKKLPGASILSGRYLSIILFIAAFPFHFIFENIKPGFGLLVIGNLIACVVSFILNFWGKVFVSNFILLTATIIGTFYYAFTMPLNTGVYTLFFALYLFPNLMFEIKHRSVRLFFTIVPIILMVLRFIPSLNPFEVVTIASNPLNIHLFSVFMVSVIIISFVFVFIREIYAFQNTLFKKNTDLEKALIKLKQSRDSQILLSQHADYARLVQSIAHEFKNPLQMLQGTAEIGLLQDDKNKEIFTTIISSVERLNNVIQPMLTYLNTDSNYEFQSFDIIETINDILLLSKANCKAKGIELELNNEASRHISYGDSTAIGQVFINLITNAIDAIGNNKGLIKIKVFNDEFMSNNNLIDGICIQVIDTGVGIEKDQLKTIFSPYESTKKEANNVGLGLSIVSKIIKEHSGLISIESEVNQGTTMSVWLCKSDAPTVTAKQQSIFELNNDEFE